MCCKKAKATHLVFTSVFNVYEPTCVQYYVCDLIVCCLNACHLKKHSVQEQEDKSKVTDAETTIWISECFIQLTNISAQLKYTHGERRDPVRLCSNAGGVKVAISRAEFKVSGSEEQRGTIQNLFKQKLRVEKQTSYMLTWTSSVSKASSFSCSFVANPIRRCNIQHWNIKMRLLTPKWEVWSSYEQRN